MASLTEHAIVNVRKLIYSTYFEDFDNRISTNARINNDDPDDGYCSDGDIYSYNHTVRAKRIKVFKKKYYCIDNRQREQYTDSKTALINIIGSMTLMLKADRKTNRWLISIKNSSNVLLKIIKVKPPIMCLIFPTMEIWIFYIRISIHRELAV